jgi:hypothetical protein
MSEIDYSVWAGRPPRRAKVMNGDIPDAAEDEEEEALEHKTDSKSPSPESVSSQEVSASPREEAQAYSQAGTQSSISSTDHNCGLYIDIPELSNKQDYQHLPGYFTVHKILRELTPGHYLVKLKSGEVDLVSLLLTNVLQHCPSVSLPSLTEMLLSPSPLH